MQAESSEPVKTFSIGFHENAYNEAEYAKKVAGYLETDHTELYVSPGQAIEIIPRLADIYDEPFSDPSQLPTLLVAEMTRKHVTVALTGDGGDEIFAGYDRYFFTESFWKKTRNIPYPARKSLRTAIRTLKPEAWSSLLGWTAPLIKTYGGQGKIGDKLYKGTDLLDYKSFNELYVNLLTHWENAGTLVLDGDGTMSSLVQGMDLEVFEDPIQKMQYLDMKTNLVDDILVKVDRSAMSVSLETRAPLLDHKIIEYAWRLPKGQKFNEGDGKWILRRLVDRYIPSNMMDRPKMGFAMPIDSWLRGPLRDWAEDLLDERRLSGEGFFDPAPIRKKLSEHLSGERNWQFHLWDALMFESWLDSLN
jgi:asparagine synthase (glutamine-hydrolysing)